jgi:hypothetical protein
MTSSFRRSRTATKFNLKKKLTVWERFYNCDRLQGAQGGKKSLVLGRDPVRRRETIRSMTWARISEGLSLNSKFPTSLSRLVLCVLFLSVGLGCAPLWKAMRESERTSAIESARIYSSRGKCQSAIHSLDRAMARLDIGAYGEEATGIRLRCYQSLGRVQAARAHKRLLEDFYGQISPAYPAADGCSVFRVAQIPNVEYQKLSSALKLVAPSYTEHARRSYIAGRVVVSFQLTQKGLPRSIRVLEMTHPLLASWAIEAVERIVPDERYKDALQLPESHYLAKFDFSSHWAPKAAGVSGSTPKY